MSESRAVRFIAPVVLNDITIYDDSTGTVGGPAATCVGASAVQADTSLTGAAPATTTVNTEENLTLTVTNLGPTTGTGSFFSFALPAGMELIGGTVTVVGATTVTVVPVVNGQHLLVPLGDAPPSGTLHVVVRVKTTVA